MAHPTDSSVLFFPCPFCHNPHSTALPSLKRYDKRYEEKFQGDIRPHHQPRGHGLVPGMWRCKTQDVSPVLVVIVNTMVGYYGCWE